jgi:hypothetical protein
VHLQCSDLPSFSAVEGNASPLTTSPTGHVGDRHSETCCRVKAGMGGRWGKRCGLRNRCRTPSRRVFWKPPPSSRGLATRGAYVWAGRTAAASRRARIEWLAVLS